MTIRDFENMPDEAIVKLAQEAGTHILQSSIEISLITYLQVVNQNFIGV